MHIHSKTQTVMGRKNKTVLMVIMFISATEECYIINFMKVLGFISLLPIVHFVWYNCHPATSNQLP